MSWSCERIIIIQNSWPLHGLFQGRVPRKGKILKTSSCLGRWHTECQLYWKGKAYWILYGNYPLRCTSSCNPFSIKYAVVIIFKLAASRTYFFFQWLCELNLANHESMLVEDIGTSSVVLHWSVKHLTLTVTWAALWQSWNCCSHVWLALW